MAIAGGGQQIEVDCRLLSDGELPATLRLAADSCGLDFWQSASALRWLGTYLDAYPVLITVRAGARVAALCCLLRRLPFGLRLASAYPYAGIAGDASLFWESSAAVAAALRGFRVVRLEMPFSGEYAQQADGRLPSDGRLTFAPALDAVRHVADLMQAHGNPDWLASQLAPNTRWAVRKAERLGGRIRSGLPADLDVVQSIYVAAMRVKGAPVNYGLDRFRGMLNELSSAGSARIYIGEIAGAPVGMAAVLDAGMSRHLLQLAVMPAAQSARLSDLLVSAAMRDAIGVGLRYFDFMASNPQDAGLVAFKSKWATREEPIRYAVLRVNRIADFAIGTGRWINIQRGRVLAHVHRSSVPANRAPEQD